MKSSPAFEHWQFIFKVLSVIIIDLSLSGDNAVLIAAAARSLPRSARSGVLLGGALCAVVALVAATFFATRLLTVKFLQLLGGAAILWIAIGLFRAEAPLESSAKQVSGYWKAMWFVVVANVMMSTDNILAIAAVAQGNFFLLLFGLGLSIPMVFLASGIIANLMNDYPFIAYIGAALLGRVAGQMIVTDPFVVQTLAPSIAVHYAVEVSGVIGVILAGIWLKTRGPRTGAS